MKKYANAKEKILIVDDMPANISILAEALKCDYDIIIATHGEKAVKLATSKNPPDLILLDIMIPGMDGYEICKKLKSNNETKNIPIIFITSKVEVEDETKGLGMGAVDYITKPFHLPIVKARVKTHLKLKRKTDMLESLAALDGLTDIPNRRRFDEFSEQGWEHSEKFGQPISLILMDIDYFKEYNDCYGHAVGDECLKKVATSLVNSLRCESDFVARYGGEEFVAVLLDADVSTGVAVAERLRHGVKSLNISHASSKVANHVTLSLGVASMTPMSGLSCQVLINAADSALYAAKTRGRDQVQISPYSED